MMRVTLCNLGEGSRVFHDRLGQSHDIGSGRSKEVDLPGNMIQSLVFSMSPETVLVVKEGEEVPDEVAKLSDMLHSFEEDNYEGVVRRFSEIAPPSNMTRIQPSLHQIKIIFRTMVEDFIVAHREKENHPIHDDVDPDKLEQERREQEDKEKWREPEHPLKRADEQRAAMNGVESSHLIEPPTPRPPPRESQPPRVRRGQAHARATRAGKG